MALFRTVDRREARADNGFTRWLDIGMNRVASGVSVTQDSALNLPVVYRCIALNSETIGALPVDTYLKQGKSRIEIKPPAWVTQPNDDDTWQDLVTSAQMSLESDGNLFLLKATTPSGVLVALYVLNPQKVKVVDQRLEDGRTVRAYKVQQDQGGPERTLWKNEVLHVRGLTKPGDARGLSPVAVLKEAIGLGLAVQEFGGRWFGDGAHMSGVIENPGPALKDEDAKRLQENFTRKHGGLRKSHAVGILSGGAKWVPMSVNAEESQFLDTGRVNASQIALAFGVPPNYATDAEGTKGYVTGVTAGKMMWLQLGLLTRIVRLETAFSSLMPTGYLKLNMRGFLRGSPEEETKYLSAQKDRGIINTDEWRAILDMNPLANGEGQEYINTLANFLKESEA